MAYTYEQLSQLPEFAALQANGHVNLNIVRGDYLVVANDSVNGSSDVVFGWGEEI